MQIKKLISNSALIFAAIGMAACNSGTTSGGTTTPANSAANAANYAVALTPDQELYASTDGGKWAKITTSGITDHVSSINCSTQICALSGNNGEFLLSKDLKAWVKPSNYFLSESLNEVIVNNNTAIAVGNSGSIVTATTSNKMTVQTAIQNVTSNNLSSIAYNATGTFVSVGANGTIFTSNNGKSWTANLAGTNANLNKVISIDNRFIIVGDNGTVLISSDGTNWAQVQAGITQNLYKIKFVDGYYYIIGDNAAMYRTSNIDTLTSSQKVNLPTAYGSNNYKIRNIAKTSSGLVAYIEDQNAANHNVLLKSIDGINWKAYKVEKNSSKDLKWSLSDFLSDVTNICSTISSDANKIVQTVTTVVDTITTVINDINDVISAVNAIPTVNS